MDHGRVRFWAMAGCALLCAGAVGCARRQAAQRPPQAGDAAVAQVGDQVIWASDVRREAVAEGLIGEGEPLAVSSALFARALDEVIDIKVMSAEAARRKLDQSPAAQRLLAAARDRILQNLLMQSVLEKTITPRSTMALYQEQVKLSRGQMQYKARQIVLATPAEADEVRRQTAQKNADFGAIAAARSIDAATKFNGGDLGFISLDAVPKTYAAALKEARAGDLVGPFRTEAGYVVMKVDDMRPEPPIALDAARPQIIRFQTYAVVKDVIDDLRKQAKVRILIDQPKAAPPAPRGPAPSPAPTDAPAPAAKNLRPAQ